MLAWYTAKIESSVSRGRVRDALTYYSWLREDAVQPSRTLVRLSSAGENAVRLTVFLPLPSAFPGICCGPALYGRAQKPTCVPERLLVPPARATRAARNRSPTQYHMLLVGAMRAGATGAMLQVLRDALERGCRPDVVLFNAALSGCSRVSAPSRALDVLREMERVGVPPNLRTYCALFAALGKRKRMDQALSLLDAMPLEPDEHVFATLIGGFRQAKDGAAAQALVARAEAAGVPQTALTGNAMLHLALDVGDDALFDETLEGMRHAGTAASDLTHAHIVARALGASEYAEARTALDEAVAEGRTFTAPTFLRLMKGALAADDGGRATESAEMALHLAHASIQAHDTSSFPLGVVLANRLISRVLANGDAARNMPERLQRALATIVQRGVVRLHYSLDPGARQGLIEIIDQCSPGPMDSVRAALDRDAKK